MKDEIISVIKKHVCLAIEGLEENQLDSAASLENEYGATSLDMVSIVSSTMRELKIKVPRTELKDITTIDQLADLFLAQK